MVSRVEGLFQPHLALVEAHALELAFPAGAAVDADGVASLQARPAFDHGEEAFPPLGEVSRAQSDLQDSACRIGMD